MAYFPTKKQVKTAITDHSQIPVHAIHQTTTDLFQWRIGRIIEMAPTQHFKVNYGAKGILMPMPSPTIGVIEGYNRWFWVPMRTINPRWNDFQANNMHNNADTSSWTPNTTPSFQVKSIVTAIRAMSVNVQTQAEADFTIDTSGNVVHWKLTRRAKNALTILRQLGYKFNFNIDSTDTLSAQPLLAAARIYCDWYYNNNYKNSTNYNNVIKLLKYDADDLNNNLNLNSAQITQILDLIMYCYYDSAWDIDAWDNPNSPNISMLANGSGLQIDDQEMGGVSVKTLSGHVFMDSTQSTQAGTSEALFTQYTVNTLKQLQAYIKRNQLSGNDTAKRYLAQWGIQLTDELNSRSKKISEQKLETQIWRVESNSDTAQSGGDQLGSFAGNGEINGKPQELDFQANEYGYLIEVNTIMPRSFTDQGLDPIVLHKTRYDFYQPDFDGIGTTPILKQNIITDFDGRTQIATIPQTAVFGFLPRYWEYKTIRDHISGDYEYNTTKAAYESWTLQRMLSYNDPTDVIHSEDYTKGTDWNQYNRIFYSYEVGDKSKPEDRINLVHWLEGTLSGSFKGLYDDYNFDENHHNETVQV